MITHSLFEKTPSYDIMSHRIENAKGEYVDILDYGAVVHRLCVKNASGKLTDVVLGYANAKDYNNRSTYLGAAIGRTTNRISGATFSYEGKTFRLFDTGGGVSLHGGDIGFNRRLFTLLKDECTENTVALSLISHDGDQGYPGNLTYKVKYTFTDTSSLIIEYEASTDSRTIFNTTNHSTFNLSGHDSDTPMLENVLCINSDYVTPLGSDFTPTGKLENVEGTLFDFKTPKEIGRDINADNDQLKLAGGYDINYVLNPFEKLQIPANISKTEGFEGLNTAAYAYSKRSGVAMVVKTDLPCLLFYSGNFLVKCIAKDSASYNFRYGFCLETQLYPDAVNKKTFPPISLFPGENYHSKTVYSFSTLK